MHPLMLVQCVIYWHIRKQRIVAAMRVADAITLSSEEKKMLAEISRSQKTSVRLAQRAKIVLPAADGMQNIDIAGRLGNQSVQGWPLARALSAVRAARDRKRCASIRSPPQAAGHQAQGEKEPNPDTRPHPAWATFEERALFNHRPIFLPP